MHCSAEVKGASSDASDSLGRSKMSVSSFTALRAILSGRSEVVNDGDSFSCESPFEDGGFSSVSPVAAAEGVPEAGAGSVESAGGSPADLVTLPDRDSPLFDPSATTTSCGITLT
ncbi:hypothetical protein BOVATA_010970 [Babesia ovata]|uniref:Uncharacterized protein n=1 Tax=Babesia ovata TaxID=189622 RepID=A0A2H6K9C1_9APIC|nr:uncharacterized protein BOVATA_010970 [Babesia ovata]GBE59604.1 hypothetical protein BOVATA_010970 [Babesia ovata]